MAERETCHVADNADRKEGELLALHLPPVQYRIRHLERLKLGMSYPAQVQYVKRLLQRDPLASYRAATYVDGTGVGRSVMDTFRQAHIVRLYSVTITGGEKVTRDMDGWHASKLDLISRVQAMLHSQTLTIEPELADATVLMRELQDFRVSFSTAGNPIFGAREGAHDDLVLAVAMAIFGATRSEPVTHIGLRNNWIV